MGDLDAAEKSLTESVRLNPNSGEYRWRLANLQLRQGEVESAVTQIGKALELDPALRPAALALLAKTGAELSTIESVWPDDRASRLALLRALSTSRSASEPPIESLDRQWSRLAADSEVPSVAESRPFLNHLVARGETELARRRWVDVHELNGEVDDVFASEANLVWNGGFEQVLSGGPLGWQIRSSPGAEVERVVRSDDDTGHVVRVEFDGSENLSFAGLRQVAVVPGGSRYELSYRVRSDRVSTDQGPLVELLPGNGGPALYSGPMILGTSEWRDESAEVEVPVGVETVQLRLRRSKSRQIDSRIAGTVWIDDVELRRPDR